MAASPTSSQIARANRQGLYALRRRLLKYGIESRYEKKTGVLEITGTNVEWAAYRLLRASNGECALYPRVKFRSETSLPSQTQEQFLAGNLGASKSDARVYEGWDAFDKIITSLRSET